MRQVLTRVWAFIGTDLLTGIVLGSAATLFLFAGRYGSPWAGVLALFALLITVSHLIIDVLRTPEPEVVERVRIVAPRTKMELLRAALEDGQTLYPNKVLNTWGIDHLASAISKLRKEGLNIESVPYDYYGYKRTAYRLA